MSTCGYFLIIKIKIEKDIGIINAAKFPIIAPGDNEVPTIKVMPTTARIIENKVTLDIFSFKNIYPNIAKNKI